MLNQNMFKFRALWISPVYLLTSTLSKYIIKILTSEVQSNYGARKN